MVETQGGGDNRLNKVSVDNPQSFSHVDECQGIHVIWLQVAVDNIQSMAVAQCLATLSESTTGLPRPTGQISRPDGLHPTSAIWTKMPLASGSESLPRSCVAPALFSKASGG